MRTEATRGPPGAAGPLGGWDYIQTATPSQASLGWCHDPGGVGLAVSMLNVF